MPEKEGLRTTVHEIKKYPANILETERRVQRQWMVSVTAPPVKPKRACLFTARPGAAPAHNIRGLPPGPGPDVTHATRRGGPRIH